MRFNVPLFLISVFIISVSCNQEKSSKGKILTKRIQYDVNIKSPDPDMDWYVQNIEGEKREEFVRTLLERAYSGEVQTYDFFNRPLTAKQVWEIGNRRDTLAIQRIVPPYDFVDTVIEQNFEIQDVTRIRFLEEWTYEEDGFTFQKEVIGICPVLRRFNSDGTLRGYMPMFWVYFDKDYPANISLNHPAATN